MNLDFIFDTELKYANQVQSFMLDFVSYQCILYDRSKHNTTNTTKSSASTQSKCSISKSNLSFRLIPNAYTYKLVKTNTTIKSNRERNRSWKMILGPISGVLLVFECLCRIFRSSRLEPHFMLFFESFWLCWILFRMVIVDWIKTFIKW